MPRMIRDPRVQAAALFDALWADQEGHACLALADPGDEGRRRFRDHYFEWPAQRDEALDLATAKAAEFDVYYVPSLLSKPDRKKANALPHSWIWTDLDGAEVGFDELKGMHAVQVTSGTPGNLHVYLHMDDQVPPAEIQRLNQALVQRLGGDRAPTHSAALMRVPGTFNHKGGKQTRVRLVSSPNGFGGFTPDRIDALLGTGAAVRVEQRTTLPEVIPQGERETHLVSIAGAMRRKAAEAEEILAALEVVNQRRCEPPVEHHDLERIAKSVAGYRPADVPGLREEGHELGVRREAERLRVRREATTLVNAEEASRSWTPPVESGDLTTLLAAPRDPVPHRIEGLGKVGTNITLAAQYKAGKTTMIGNLARSLVDGVPFLGFEVATPLVGNVALWNYELDHDEFIDWLRALGIRDTSRVHVLTLRGHRHPLVVDHIAEWTADWLRSREIEGWVLDPAARAFSGSGEENSNDDVTRFTEALDVIKREAGVQDLWLPTHIGRAQEEGQERSRGASRWDDWPDVLWCLARKGNNRYFRATGRKVEVEEFELEFDLSTGRMSPSGRAGRAEAVATDRAVWLAQAVKREPGRPKAHWEREMDGGAKAFRAAVAKAVEDHLVHVRRGANGAHLLHPGADGD